jgi:hypothetical protein
MNQITQFTRLVNLCAVIIAVIVWSEEKLILSRQHTQMELSEHHSSAFLNLEKNPSTH